MLAALLLDDERLKVQLHAREDEAAAPERERDQRDVEEAVGDEPRVSARPEHAPRVCVTNMKKAHFRKLKIDWK